MSKQDQQRIYKVFTQKPISFNAGLALALGSVEAAIMLGQLLYWKGLGENKTWMYKTIEEMKTETGLSRSQQERVIRQLKSLGFIQIVRKSIPAKRHFKVDTYKIEAFLSSRLQENSKLHSEEIAATDGVNGETITENNQIINKEGYKKFQKSLKELKRRNLNGRSQRKATTS